MEPLGGVCGTLRIQRRASLLSGGFAFGFLLVLVTTFLINHFDLFGLRQVVLYLLGREYERSPSSLPAPIVWCGTRSTWDGSLRSGQRRR
jgi:hypothetical protein